MKYFYSASVMGYGEGRQWHRYYNFPRLPMVTETLTWNPKIGIPFAIIKKGNSVWNRVGLHNMGFFNWHREYFFKWSYNFRKNITISMAGTDDQIEDMIGVLEAIQDYEVGGIELNFSCPNVKSYNNLVIPKTDIPLYLKLNWEQDPYNYVNIDRIEGIRVNSVPGYFGGISGRAAQKYNWKFIEIFNREGFNVSGCSITSNEDIKILEDLSCKDIGIGSIMLTDSGLVERLDIKYD
jgi:dihydroorotate dehydrogenase